jgi:hypothetical protein
MAKWGSDVPDTFFFATEKHAAIANRSMITVSVIKTTQRINIAKTV